MVFPSGKLTIFEVPIYLLGMGNEILPYSHSSLIIGILHNIGEQFYFSGLIIDFVI